MNTLIKNTDLLKSLESLPRKIISESGDSVVYSVRHQEKIIYLKHYFRESGLKHWLKSWVKNKAATEILNLNFFRAIGIPCPEVLGFQIKKTAWGQFKSAIIALEGLENTLSLADIVNHKHPIMNKKSWRKQLIVQLAHQTARIHQLGFAHVDLKWRNILITLDNSSRVFWIDCPSGYFVSPYFSARASIKDLACLNKVAKKVLSQSSRLRFFKLYLKNTKLCNQNKKLARQITTFFHQD